jgi:predicted dehydrogenase
VDIVDTHTPPQTQPVVAPESSARREKRRPPARPLRLAVAGAHRARSFGRALAALRAEVAVVALCDVDAAALAAWQAAWAPEHGPLPGFEAYERMLDVADCDAVFLATPMALHAPQAIQALRSGRHVLSEVIAATTLDECWALVETVEATGRVYMLAENYCYMRPNMLVRRMVEAGVFGERIYAEGGYLHDTRHLLFRADGTLTWRGQIARDHAGNAYPTHSLGPVAQWLGAAGPDAPDQLLETATWTTPDRTRWQYAARRFGGGHPAAQPGAFRLGDATGTLIRTRKGALIYLRRDPSSPRPHNLTHYELQGTQACYLAARHAGEDPLIWIDGRSPGGSPGGDGQDSARWEPLWAYAGEFEHPRWREHAAAARGSGHGGGDFFILEDFARAVRRGVSPIDVYDAVTWSSIMPLSAESVARGGAPVPIPDFRRRAAPGKHAPSGNHSQGRAPG